MPDSRANARSDTDDGIALGLWRSTPPVVSAAVDDAPSLDTTPTRDTWRQELSANAAFCMLGIGVALPWTTLRSGISVFSTSFPLGRSFLPFMFCAYYAIQLPLLLLQSTLDRRYDIRFGSRNAFTFRLVIALVALSASLLAVPYGGQTTVLCLTGAVGLFDAVAYGTASQLFSAFHARAGATYFLGSSLASLVAIVLSYATGFASLNDEDGHLPLPSPVHWLYTGAACVVGASLVTTAALMASKLGITHFNTMDAHLTLSSPVASPSGRSRLEEFDDGQDEEGESVGTPLLLKETVQEELVDGEHAVRVLRSDAGISKADPASGEQEAVPGSPIPLSGTLDILYATRYCHAALSLLWLGTTLADSLIAFVPSQQDTRVHMNTRFRLAMAYASLIGELSGKNLNLLCGTRCVMPVGKREGEGRARDSAHTSVAPLSQKVLLVLAVARTLLLAPFLYYITQPLLSPGNGGSTPPQPLPGYYNDILACAFQALFDCGGAFLSSLTYGLAPTLLPHAGQGPQSSTLLALSLMIGTGLGLGLSLGVTRVLTAQEGLPPT